MPDRPPHDPGPDAPVSGPTPSTGRSLSEILEQLAVISHAREGEAFAMRGAVSELSRALAELFEMIRVDRATQERRIGELEAELRAAQEQIAALERGEAPAPAPSDFDALRGAAERLRLRTAQLVQEAGTPAQEAARAASPDAGPVDESERVRIAAADAAEEARIEAARRAVEASLAEDEHEAALAHEGGGLAARDEPFGRPGILRVFPGSAIPAPGLDVESDLAVREPLQAEALAMHAPPVPVAGRPGDAPTDGPAVDEDPQVAPPAPELPRVPRPQPVAVAPRAASKRRRLRRRRIDARKLTAVDPAAALRAMVGAIDGLWTAGHQIDLVIALTDGGTLHVTGGDREPLSVVDVAPGTRARTTVTATSEQLVPLFGRLDLTEAQSAPLIHGTRRDADLLVGWIDRAQRLDAAPL